MLLFLSPILVVHAVHVPFLDRLEYILIFLITITIHAAQPLSLLLLFRSL